MIYWDEKSIYLEQQFVTASDNFVRAVCLSKQTIIGLNVEQLMAKLMNKDPSYRPEIHDDLRLWMQSMEASSAKLRKKD